MKNELDINARNASGGTALLEACKNGNLEVVKLLLDAGADPWLGLHDGRTPLMAAEFFGHYEVSALLERHLRRQIEGYVFLSWTTNHPRDRVAMGAIKQSLLKCDIGYFDYTKYPVDDSKDQSKIIQSTVREHISRCHCSIELMTSEILGAPWVEFEREEIHAHGCIRIFACLQEEYMLARSTRYEDKIVRVNLSDGRVGVHADSIDRVYYDTAAFGSSTFFQKCLRLALHIKTALRTNDWNPLRNDREFSRSI